MRRTLLILTLIAGIAAALGSLAAAAGLAGLMLFVERDALDGTGLMLGALALALGTVAPGLGLLAAWHAGRGLQDKPSGTFRLPPWGWLLLALVLVLAGGQVLFSGGVEPAVAVSHVLAAILASLLMLAIPVGVARRHGLALGRRAGAASLAWGALGGVALAGIIELVLVLVIGIAALLLLGALAPAWLENVSGILQTAGGAGGAVPEALVPFLTSPLALLAGLLIAGVLVPLTEELVKSLAIPLVHMSGRTLTPLDAFLIGAAAGAGFTLIEGITNGAMALMEPSAWAMGMAARGGVAVIHVLGSALAGVAWHAGLVRRQWGKALALFAAAVLLHGVWNGGAIGLVWGAFAFGIRPPGLGNLLMLMIVALLGAVFVSSLILLAILPRRLALRALVDER